MLFIFIMILSFLLDGVLSNIFLDNSLFIPLISLMSIIVLKNKFNIDNNTYLFYVSFIGLFYDLIYTSTPVLNMMIYFILGNLVIYYYKIINKNLFSELFLASILIIIYRVLTFIVLVIANNIEFNISILINSIYRSMLLNYIYIVIMYFITNKNKEKKYKI